MLEVLLNYGILFIVFLGIVGVVSLIRRSKGLSSLFKSLGKGMLSLLQLGMLAFFIVIISMIVGLMIGIHPFVLGTPQFLAGGEPIHILAPNDGGLLQFSLTYGILYVALYFVSIRILAKNKVTWFFVDFIREVRLKLPYRRSLKRLESRVFGTVCQLMTTMIMLILYPIIISLFFQNLSMTWAGNLFIFTSIIIFSLIPTPGRVDNRQDKPLYRPQSVRKKVQ